MRPLLLSILLFLASSSTSIDAFSTQRRFSAQRQTFLSSSNSNEEEKEQLPTIANSKPKTIAVTGATGRTGRLVIQQLIESTNHNVVALVRDESKAQKIFIDGEKEESTASSSSIEPFINDQNKDRLTIQKCNLLNRNEINSIISSTNVDQLIWCSTGFSNNPNASPLDRLSTLWNAIVQKGENTIDYVGLITLAEAIEANKKESEDVVVGGPKVIMLSSAGVTRPSWTEEKKVK